MQKKYKSYFTVYLILWLSILICSKLFLNERVFTIYFVITLLFAIIINAFEGHRITNYLRENNKVQYIKNRSFRNVNGVVNNFSAFEFLVSNNDSDNIDIAKLKSNYKKTILLIAIIFFSYPIFFIISREGY